MIPVSFLEEVADHGSEPARAAFAGAQVLYSRIPELEALLARATAYPEAEQIPKIQSFYAHFLIYYWYLGEALRWDDRYLLMHATANFALFGGRLILAHNRILYPYHKWFMHELRRAPERPDDLIERLESLLERPCKENADALLPGLGEAAHRCGHPLHGGERVELAQRPRADRGPVIRRPPRVAVGIVYPGYREEEIDEAATPGRRAVCPADGPRHVAVRAAGVRANAPYLYLRVCAARRRPVHVGRLLHPDRVGRTAGLYDAGAGEGEGRMSGTPLPEEARPVVEAMAKKEDRIVVRCRPYATQAQPPRHLHRNDQEEQIAHWISPSMPWDAADEGPA